MGQDNLKGAIEAMLFSSDRPLTLEQFKKALDNLETTQIRKVLESLSSDLEASGRGMRIVEVAGGFQMITASSFAPFLKKLYQQRRVEKLSKPALETLAMIAYKQPVTKTQVEALRGVNVDGVIKSLTDKGLVRIAGRRKAPGRPYVYSTTRTFLEYFGLKSLEELPKIENFQAPPNTGEESDELKEPAQTN